MDLSFAPTACPGAWMMVHMADLAEKVTAELGSVVNGATDGTFIDENKPSAAGRRFSTGGTVGGSTFAGMSSEDMEKAARDFLMKELREGYTGVLRVLTVAKSVKVASDVVLMQYERPADQSEAMKAKRDRCGQEFYEKYAGTESLAGKERIRRQIAVIRRQKRYRFL